MKILFITPFPPPVTGNSLAVKILFDELNKSNQIEVVNLSKKSFKNGFNSFERIIEVVSILKQVWIKKRKVDRVYFTISESFAGNIKDLFIYLICYFKLDRMIVHLHGGAGIRTIMLGKKNIQFTLNRLFIKRLGSVIVLGKTHMDIFSGVISKSKMHVIPNFAEDYLFLSEEEIIRKFEKSRPIRILFLSNLLPGKGHIELVNAFLELNDNLKENISIDFAGGFESENQKAEFLNIIRGIKGINYHGILSGVEKRNIFSKSQIFCLPTYYPYEGQPISILEAYATGCVVVTTNHSGIPDIFMDGINGFEVQKKSVNSIKLVIEKILSNPEQLMQIALSNSKIAFEKYRTSIFNTAVISVINDTGMNSDATLLK